MATAAASRAAAVDVVTAPLLGAVGLVAVPSALPSWPGVSFTVAPGVDPEVVVDAAPVAAANAAAVVVAVDGKGDAVEEAVGVALVFTPASSAATEPAVAGPVAGAPVTPAVAGFGVELAAGAVVASAALMSAASELVVLTPVVNAVAVVVAVVVVEAGGVGLLAGALGVAGAPLLCEVAGVVDVALPVPFEGVDVLEC